MSRMPDDRLRRNSNQCVKGIPVTVKIPTHVDAVINEQYFITKGKSVASDGSLDANRETTQIPNLGKPLRTVSLSTVYTPKVLTTNFVRPAAGTLGIGSETEDGISMDPDNYFASIKAKIDDQTVEDVNSAIPSIKTILGIPSPVASKVSAGGDPTELAQCESFSAVIAYRRFDINTPGWEYELQEFVDSHINCQQAPCLGEDPGCYVETPIQ